MTPLEHYPDLAVAIGVSDLYFKREDLHPYGSHKGRSIPLMIDKYREAGDVRFAISSSGNAALAAAIHIKKINESTEEKLILDIFVGNHIAQHKLERLEKLIGDSNGHADEHIRILKKERPLQALNQAMNEGMRSLRQSTDDTALVGYESLGKELVEQLDERKEEKNGKGGKKLGAIFIGTSSGTTAQALADYFLNNGAGLKKGAKNGSVAVPQIHIVQTSSCHPLADALNSYDGPSDEISDADAITDITALRKGALIPLIEKTGGSGWFATNEDIETARILVKKHTVSAVYPNGLEISTNSALSVVGAMQAVYAGHQIEGAVVCLICGA